MKLFFSLILVLSITDIANAQSHLSYNFSTDPKWNYYSNKNYSCKVKNGKYYLSNSGKLSIAEFSNDYNHMEYKEVRFSTAFTPIEIDENSSYGLSGGYHGHARYTPPGTYKYYHIIFEINKLKKTFSVYDFSINGDQHTADGVPNYLVKDKPTDEIKTGGTDDLSFCRKGGEWKFAINSKIVYSKPDTSTQLNTSMNVFLRNKTSVALDYLDYNYIPEPLLQDLPPSSCDEKSKRYVNKEYGYSLCIDKSEKTKELTYSTFNYTYLNDFVLIEGFSDLPFNVYSIDFKNETDSSVVFKQFEKEFFEKLGNTVVKSKELSTDIFSKAENTDKYNSWFRGYTITLASGDKGKVCFEYLMAGNSMFDALCFGYLAPDGLEGVSYSFRNSALLLQCDVLEFR